MHAFTRDKIISWVISYVLKIAISTSMMNQDTV